MKPITAIVKVTFGCNLHCAYCYEGHRPKQPPMTFQTAENLIMKFAEYGSSSGSRVIFIWHGGEPLLMGIDFFKHVVAVQQLVKSSFHFRNSLQTNGVLLSDEFMQFFVQHDFSIGVSLDGPPIIHDAQRCLHDGSPSFHQAFEALKRTGAMEQESQALAIFTQHTLKHLDEFYEFFRSHQINVKMNSLLLKGRATESATKDLSVSPEEYGQALISLFDKWVNEPRYAFCFQPFDYMLRSFATEDPYECHFAGRCQNYLKIEPNGNIKPCGKHDDESYVYGNINSDSITDALTSANYRRFTQERSQVIESCGACRHFDICHGGCGTYASTRRQKVSDPDFYCKSYMVLFDHMKHFVKEQLCYEE